MDELDLLFVDNDQNKMLIRDALLPYVMLSRDGGIFWKHDPPHLKPKQAVVALLLAQLALYIKGAANMDILSEKKIALNMKGIASPSLYRSAFRLDFIQDCGSDGFRIDDVQRACAFLKLGEFKRL